MKHDLYDGDCCIRVSRVEGRGSVTDRSENTDLRGDGEIQGGAKLLLNYRREELPYSAEFNTQTTNITFIQHAVSTVLCCFFTVSDHSLRYVRVCFYKSLILIITEYNETCYNRVISSFRCQL